MRKKNKEIAPWTKKRYPFLTRYQIPQYPESSKNFQRVAEFWRHYSTKATEMIDKLEKQGIKLFLNNKLSSRIREVLILRKKDEKLAKILAQTLSKPQRRIYKRYYKRDPDISIFISLCKELYHQFDCIIIPKNIKQGISLLENSPNKELYELYLL